MHSKRPNPLCAAVLAATLGLPLGAMAQQSGQPTAQPPGQAPAMSVVVGHNVVDALDDVRETTADLIGALMDADEGLGFGGWGEKARQLDQMEERLEAMEETLDEKADATDAGWLSWMQDDDYGVTVTRQVDAIAGYLDQIAGMLGEARLQGGAQVTVGNDVIDQLDDLRETTGDLLDAVADAGPDYGWTNDDTRFEQARQQLQQMEVALDRQAEMTDEQWRTFLASPDYPVTIHGHLATLADIMQNLFKETGTQSS